MPAPVYVTFRHMSPRAGLEAYAREQAARLERFYDRIVDCRVLLEPSDAGVLRVIVEVSVPGERLVASQESAPEGQAAAAGRRPPAPERQWQRTLHEAFATAGRLLRDHAGRRRTNHHPRTRQPLLRA
jgi:hypothetical protein